MLTQEQIDYLFDFCKKHYVRHYDLQLELVDHLANAIEEKMKEDPKLPFETALHKVFAGFGISGFAKIVAARTRSLEKSARKLRWKLFISYFTLPKVAMTLCIFLALSSLPMYLSGSVVGIVLTLVLCLLFVFEMRVFKKAKMVVKQQKLPLLVTELGTEQPFLTALIVYQSFSIFVADDDFWNQPPGVIRLDYEFGILLIVLLLAGLFAYRDHAGKLMDHVREEYPEAFQPD
jgi:hypothetical protein